MSIRGNTRQYPAHAGPLPTWERLIIGLVLSVIATLIVVAGVSAGDPQPPASPQATRPGSGAGSRGSTGSIAAGILPPLTGSDSEQLATALAPVRLSSSLAVGVVDGGEVAVYGGERLFAAAGIVRADILAALLLQHQLGGTPMSRRQQKLAARMIENGSDQAAAALWNAIGQARGLSAANVLLQLRHTIPGRLWQRTRTTVVDQLRLLADLTSSHSLLSVASRSYELGLMRHVAADQAWGVTAAAAAGTSPAVVSGWLSGSGGIAWLVNSIGVISRDGHQILVVVLSGGHPTERAGIVQVEAAVRAAVSAITRPARSSPGRS
jgi:hypothetical protein